MIVDNDINFIKNINYKRVLALDVSKKCIGIAITDTNLKIALPIKTIIRSKFLNDISSIIDIYNNYNCGGILIGYPINLDGTLSKRCQSIRSFTKMLLEHLETHILLENEQFSTFAIKDLYKSSKIKIRKPLDANAAAYFLQNFLNRLNNSMKNQT